MRLLICTQTVDRPDPALGFFHAWIEALAAHYEHVEVICLKEGEHTLPKNVSVHSLGKEHGAPFPKQLVYAVRFLRLAWKLRRRYDTVLVHMNQEYVLLMGWLWKLQSNKIYLWRNHYAGSLFTRIAALFCTKVFYTSKFSYTARFTNSMQMPVGVDIDSVQLDVPIARTPHSILFLARLDASKRPHLLLDALGLLKERGVFFVATIAGGPSDPASTYPEQLRAQAARLGIEGQISFIGAVPNTETFRQYRSHEIFVNCSQSGMLDKTIFKAIASGCLVVAVSKDFGELAGKDFVFTDGDAKSLADKLEQLLARSPGERASSVEQLGKVIHSNSLSVLVPKLVTAMHVQ